MDYIVNSLSVVSNNFSRFFTVTLEFFKRIIDFISNFVSILETLWFGVKTLLSGVWSLIVWVFDGTLFDYLYRGFNDLSFYIGFGGATFIASILFVVMVRICIGFVFKMFRLNVDYKTMKTKWNK